MMKKRKLFYYLIATVAAILIICCTTSCTTQRSTVKHAKAHKYKYYRPTNPNWKTTDYSNTRYYIKNKKRKHH